MTRPNGPIRDEAARKLWMLRHATHCEACGIPAYALKHSIGLTCHHLIKRGRSDEPTNLMALCMYCHDAAELRKTVQPDGTVAPVLCWQAGLTLKMFRDLDEYDWSRVHHLLDGRSIETDLALVPRYFEDRYRRNRPNEKKKFVLDSHLEPIRG